MLGWTFAPENGVHELLADWKQRLSPLGAYTWIKSEGILIAVLHLFIYIVPALLLSFLLSYHHPSLYSMQDTLSNVLICM